MRAAEVSLASLEITELHDHSSFTLTHNKRVLMTLQSRGETYRDLIDSV